MNQVKSNHLGRFRGEATIERRASEAEKHRAVHAVPAYRFKAMRDPRNKIRVEFMVNQHRVWTAIMMDDAEGRHNALTRVA